MELDYCAIGTRIKERRAKKNNRMYLVKMRETVLHGIFNCPMQFKDEWGEIAEKCFMSIEEEL